jgi:hypothetical protein
MSRIGPVPRIHADAKSPVHIAMDQKIPESLGESKYIRHCIVSLNEPHVRGGSHCPTVNIIFIIIILERTAVQQ